MKAVVISSVCAVCVVLVIAVAGSSLAATKPSSGGSALVQRGEYLVTIGGCNDCHTPWKMGPNGPEQDMSRMLSGHPETVTIQRPADPPAPPWGIAVAPTFTAWSGPWGVSFTANLTPIRRRASASGPSRTSSRRCAPGGTRAAGDRSCRPCPGSTTGR